ncbi:ABC transporter permease subunit [Cohnella thailandensis]|uniref:Sugar ABC transporter permease n=1 Tax=Cohnella thailandensis TaxID=557557 RepID=A0A841SWS6_9BACL|nr:sugar ABC transporter permease [Cohnella thailandensis]MBP1972816.1 putative aldouronate transport system permease protein [Cohnella thailandensis]
MNTATTIKKKEKIVRRKDNWQLYLMLSPAVVLAFIFVYIPFGGIVMAFQDYKPYLGISGSKWVGWEQFKFMFEYPDSVQVFWNTLRISLLKLFFGTVSTLTFALLINEVRKKFLRSAVQTFVFLPHFLSWVVLGGIFLEILDPTNGLVNEALKVIGFDPIFFLGDNNWFVITVVASDVWKEFGYGSIVFLAALAGINPALYEAAQLDGAGRWKQTLHITLPSIVPTIAVVLTLSISQVLNVGFDQIFNLYNPLVYGKGDIIDTFVYRMGLVDGNYSFSTAVGLFKSVVSLFLILGAYRIAYKVAGYKIF